MAIFFKFFFFSVPVNPCPFAHPRQLKRVQTRNRSNCAATVSCQDGEGSLLVLGS